MLFIAKHISTIPPNISKAFEGNFLKKFPVQKPIIDIKNDISPIIITDLMSGVSVSFKLTPEAKASILVAIPNAIKHFQFREHNFSLFPTKAPEINFIPKNKNIAKTIIDEYGSIYLSIKDVPP